MRLDARAGDTGWDVWHVPTCRQVRYCVWVDDEAAQYGAWDSRRAHADALIARLGTSIFDRPHLPDPEPPTHQAKRITIHADRRLVLIDPIEDIEPESVADVIEAARNTPAETVVSVPALVPAYPVAAAPPRRGHFARGLRALGYLFN